MIHIILYKSVEENKIPILVSSASIQFYCFGTCTEKSSVHHIEYQDCSISSWESHSFNKFSVRRHFKSQILITLLIGSKVSETIFKDMKYSINNSSRPIPLIAVLFFYCSNSSLLICTRASSTGTLLTNIVLIYY